MNVGRAFSFVFQDPRWFGKFVAAAGLLLVPILGWLLLFGYWLRLARGVVAGTDVPLPAWDGWGDLLADGLRASVVAFAWSLLPTILFLVPNLAEGGNAGLFVLGSVLLNLVVVVVTPAALARVAVRRSLLAGIEGGPVVRLVGRNVRDYLVIFGLSLALIAAAGIVLALVALVAIVLGALTESTVGGMAFVLVVGLGALLVLPYVQSVLYHLYGQAYYRADPPAWSRSRSPALD
ncbi:MAG: DUF4013 domain-containing protein [Chloroflexota bacterium]|nr:DUF4013 domain-containing protein [Chloroflexota bacterium]